MRTKLRLVNVTLTVEEWEAIIHRMDNSDDDCEEELTRKARNKVYFAVREAIDR